ncbi:hemagglutinin repeat-containing protein [Pseudomonas parafulva]|uniref:hemagglutinin repeat-containing protein n=1 Tax=Pseudomonas parafulva TaxID=157782 RepID=UPI0007340779|nr:hemagglutinin repeat-containing protein [Pseudomonas parafulva]
MDVRQLTLAAQPTAVLADRPNFLGLPKRLLAVLLANVMFWQPIWAMADGIAVSGTTNTQVGKAGNGVPVVYIAAPNAVGLSHNQYERYNVDSQGLILNNSTQAIQGTQLGGNILGNQQLGGRAASTILNEVNGANATQLQGYTEVAGQAARVIVANPHGVTCNGCGFINTPRVTLSTGKPVLDATGKLDHFAVDGGSISIEGQGLDASNIDQFDLITRSAKLNADLYAKRLNVVAGANDVNADTLATTPRQGDPADKPQLAIDSSALGGMYADTIKLVGTEQGVGVKTAGNLAASAGDIQIDANGQLNMAQASAKGALNVTAPSVEMTGKAYANSVNVRTPGELVNRQSLAARERVEIDASTLSNPGTVAAGIENDNSRNAIGDVTVRAASLDNVGTLQASRNLTVEASQRIDNRGVLQAQRTQLTTATLSNQGKAARVVGEQALFVAAPAVVNLGGVLLFGNGQDVTLDLARLDNREGLLQAVNGKLTLNVATLDNAAGQIDAKTLNVSSDTLDNRAGLLSASGGDAQVTARMRLDNRDGTVQAQRHLNASTGQADNQGGRLLAVTGDLDLATTGLDNRNGSLLGTGIRVTAPQADIDNRQGKIIGERLDLDVAQLDNRQGQIVGEQLAITAKRLDNRDQGLLAAGTQGLTLDFARSATQAQLLNDGGRVQSDASLLLRGAWLDNSGGTVIGRSLSLDTQRLYNDAKGALVSDGGDVQLSVSDVLSNLTGIIDAGQHGVTLDGAAAVDNSGGSLRGQRLDLHANTLNNGQGGQLVAGSDGLRYTGGTLNNDAGIVLATAGTTALQLGQAALSNLGGIIQGDSVEITAARLDNGSQSGKAGSIASLVGGLTLNAATLANAGGTLFAKTALRSIGTILSNTQGGQISGETLDLEASQVDNHGGLIEANSRFTLSARALDNRDGQLTALGHSLVGLTAASDLSRLELTGSLLNQNGRIAAGNTDFSLKAALLDNRGGRIEHAGDGLLSLVFDRVSGVGGRITALGAGDWQFGQVDGLGSVQLNRALTYTSDALALQTGDRLASASNLTLNLARLDNGGELLSDGDLTLNLSGDLNNRGRLSAQGLVAINAGNVTQNGGRIGAGTDARLSLTGNLDNLGYLTARQALAIDAAQILNRGTLGAQGAVTLNAERISNDPDTLLFSGGAMALRTQVFSNLYGDVYSRGDLSVANRDGNAAQRFSNLSGTVESEGAITLNAASVENAKASFELGESIVSGSLSWVCGQHCGGHDSFKRGTITIEQTLLERATQDSPGARLVAGKDLTIQASDVQNRYSLLAANGNLSITANDLLNLGATERTGQQKIVIGTPGRIDTGYWDQMEYIDVPAFNAAVAAGDFDLARFELLKARSADARFSEESNVTTWSDSSKPLYAATLQAGGTVNLNVARSVQNGSVSEHNALEILTGKLGDDQTGVPVGGIDITLNKQAVDASAATVAALPSVQRVTDANGQTTIVPVDYSGIPFAAVDPTAGPTFQLPQGDYGLFVRNPDPNGHYLIETNPNFTDLSRFLGSDYLLERLDIGPDANWRRLGDGLYEQRLIRDAVLAQTGQRFLADGLVSDYDQYRYLMDNALASKDALNLSLGVALTSAQVGALTHDIVWMENRVVDGQTVLVPTLYLSQVDARNVRGSSLIQGRDLNLISGGDLVNVGTLRASRDLSVSSGGSIYQGGLVEAGNNLQLIAQDSIRNAMAGQIRGENVSLAAVRGDVTNERTAIQVRDGAGYRTVTDAGSGASARQGLAVSAGRDVTNYGTLQAGRDVALQAGNDVSLLAKTDNTQKHESFEGGHRYVVTTQAKQLSSNVNAGSDLNTDAARDINVVASRANAGQNLALDAGQDVNIASAQDENASYSFKKSSGSFGRKKKHQEETYDSTNVASVIEAGQDLTINTRKAADGSVGINGGRDVNIVGSQLSAGNDLILGATNDVSVNSGVEQHGTYSKTTKSGAFGLSKSGKSQMTRNVDQVGSELTAGNDAVIASGRDVKLRASTLNAANDADVRAGLVDKNGDINLLSANNEASSHQEKYKKKTGLSLSGGFLSFSSAKEAGNEAQGRTALGSQITAMRDAYLHSERDINVVGSRVDAAGDVGLQAGRDVNVLAAQNTHSSQDWKSKKQSGIGISSDDNGVSLFAGSERNKAKDRLTQETSAASQISAGGDLNVGAKRDINQVGSDLQAFNDINLAAGRDVNVDAASESQVTERERERSRNGLTATINHNFGSTKDAVNGAGKGEGATSKASSTLRAVDSISQFLSGPTADAKFGNSKESSRQVVSQTSNRGSTLDAGNDLNIAANNDVRIRGGQLQSGRDINIQGRDITLDAAKGSYGEESSEEKSWSGIHGGTSGGFKLGVGGSRGVADSDQSQGSSTVTSLQAGRDANLKASNDLNLIGTQVQTVRDIDLQAGNDLNIRAAQNDSASSSSRRSGGGEVGLAVGSEGVGLYASVNLGKGNLKREGQQQQEAYLYAGNQLAFTSGRNSNIAGATLRGNEVVGRVGRDLTVTSLPDTGKAEGKEYDLSATVVVGPGSGVSGSMGYGRTTGSKNWVEKQTSITAQNALDIRTQNHTQLDGALIASDTGKLKLDTNTLGFSDIAGKDKEHGYYLNVGGSYGIGKNTTQDPSQVGKGDQGQNGWSVEGWNYNKDRQQIVRGTVGAGDVVVRGDNAGQDSTAGLNRDVSRAYEVTKDDEHRTDLYATKRSTEAVLSPEDTLSQWRQSVELYGENSRNATEKLVDMLVVTAKVVDGQGLYRAGSYTIFTDLKQQLRSADESTRSATAKRLLEGALRTDLGSDGDALVTRVAEIGRENPEQALQTIVLLGSLNRPEFVSNFAAVAGLAVGAAVVVSLALTAQTPEQKQKAAEAIERAAKEAGRTLEEQYIITKGIMEVVLKTSLPESWLTDRGSDLGKPIHEQGSNPSSDGYANGGRQEAIGSTGGSEVVDQAPGDYSRPIVDLPESGLVYQDSASDEKGKIPENMSPAGAGRAGAFNEAKRQSGVPVSQKPSGILPNVDKRGNPQPGKIYEFEIPASGGGIKTVRIRDDAEGHYFGTGNPQNRGPHFNDEAGNHYDY